MKLASLSTIIARRGAISILGAFVLAAMVPQAAFAQSSSEVGTWKLNLAKSKFSPGPPPKSATLIYEAVGQGLRLTADVIDADGKPIKTVRMQINDGKSYPTTGIPGSDASAYTRSNASTVTYTRFLVGKVVVTGSRVVSADGKTMTISAKGVNAKGQQTNDVTVYDKQYALNE
jgi:hypothetical protein